MPRSSPQTVTYQDLVDLAAEVERGAKARYEGGKSRGTTNLNALLHQVEVARAMRRMFEKGKPAKQTDLFTLYQQVVK